MAILVCWFAIGVVEIGHHGDHEESGKQDTPSHPVEVRVRRSIYRVQQYSRKMMISTKWKTALLPSVARAMMLAAGAIRVATIGAAVVQVLLLLRCCVLTMPAKKFKFEHDEVRDPGKFYRIGAISRKNPKIISATTSNRHKRV